MVLGQRRRPTTTDSSNTSKNKIASSTSNSNSTTLSTRSRLGIGGNQSNGGPIRLRCMILILAAIILVMTTTTTTRRITINGASKMDINSNTDTNTNNNNDNGNMDLYNRILALSGYGTTTTTTNNIQNMDILSAITNNNNNNNNNNHDGNYNYPCTIPRYSVGSKEALKGIGSKRPVILEGWNDRPMDWNIPNFITKIGNYPQYIKDLTVQPLLKNKTRNQSTNYLPAQSKTSNTVAGMAVETILKNHQTRMQNQKQQERRLKSSSSSSLSDYCILPSTEIIQNVLPNHDNTLFFTNNKENEPFMKVLRSDYQVPKEVRHINSFEVFSAMNQYKYHSFHAHGESWLGQVEGRRVWWFLPPSTTPKPDRVNACDYLTGKQPLPEPIDQITTCIQHPGEIIWFPKDWYHGTCALDEWTVGIGAQQGRTIRQQFPKLNDILTATINNNDNNNNNGNVEWTPNQIQTIKEECLDDTTTTTISSISATTSVISDRMLTQDAPSLTSSSMSNMQATRDTSNTNNNNNDNNPWKWFDGDLNAYYNSLEKDIDRDPTSISSYAVHRWMGPTRSTEEHYKLIEQAIMKHIFSSFEEEEEEDNDNSNKNNNDRMIRVFDGGCGLGSALMWLEQRHPNWELTGHTISEEQYEFIQTKLPDHKFHVNLQSYDDIPGNDNDNYNDNKFDVIYSIEALIHSMNVTKTIEEWNRHLAPGGIIIIIDDYVSEGTDKNEDGIQEFSKSWLANVLITPNEFEVLAYQNFDLHLVENRDLLTEYDIIKLNYRNQKPNIKPFGGRTHQGWMGSKWRQRLTVEGKLSYNMMVLQKKSMHNDDNNNDYNSEMQNNSWNGISSTTTTTTNDNSAECAAVPSRNIHNDEEQPGVEFTEITPQLMSGRGANGGSKMACISGWYCCNKGTEWYDHLEAHRTDNTNFLRLDRDLFGHYIDVFAKHLNQHYSTYPKIVQENEYEGGGTTTTATIGRFLDIGGTGSTASGMTKVTSKFQHFAGPLEYWKLDSDIVAQDMERTIYCDIDDCPMAETCGFDVTFSHTVLEHAKRPWKSFDTIARITKRGGLTMHLVPWSYQYHATPDDNYRFSHKALITLLEDRGFDVLEVGYDICTKPEKMKHRIDEHYDTIWLTYVVGKKR